MPSHSTQSGLTGAVCDNFLKGVKFNFVSGANLSQVSTMPRGMQVPNANARKNEIITNVLKFYSSLSLLSYSLKDNKAIKKALRSLPSAILNMLKLPTYF